MKLINIGFGNLVNADRVVAVVVPDSAPVKRIIQNAKDAGRLIDVTQGRKTLSVVFTDSEHVILSYMKPEKVLEKFNEENEHPED
ncbi:MAG: DUF370 domain-containing protein [Clostridia bacterium]|nr:DUF370 domain-containing protein [Oscillospiraceae bacterium]MBR2410658.1 DUF370 domain-containing protein [Clostridia bacterium]